MPARTVLPRVPFFLLIGLVMTFSACRGAPCSNCGAYGPGTMPQPYGQSWQTVPGQPVMPQGSTVQPGFYQPGTVPVQPTQQLPSGTVYGG